MQKAEETSMKNSKHISNLALIFILCLFLSVSGWAGSMDESGKAQINSDPPPSPTTAIVKTNTENFSLSEKSGEAGLIKLNVKPKKVDNRPKYYKNLNLTVSDRKNSGSALFTASLVSLTALNVADYLSTCKALKYSQLQEGNPLMKSITKNTLVFAGVKLGIAVCDYLILKKIYKKNKALGWVLTTAANAALSYVVYNNMKMIQRAQRGM
jgi:hypothetical protein